MSILLRKARSAIIRVRRFLVSQRFGFSPEKIYQDDFYEDGGFAKTDQSANSISSWAIRHLEPKTVLDLGCGGGHYLRAFESKGTRAMGFEASPHGVMKAGEEVTAVTYDLKRPLYVSRQFDLVMCIEVAEHIPTRFSSTLVGSISRNSAKHVLFTAAPPGTPGTDHINCQPSSFWMDFFRDEGFEIDEELTQSLRETAQREGCADWWQGWAFCLVRTAR